MVNTRSKWEDELGRWLKPFLDRLGHKARRRMCPLYVAGLIGPGDRKSVQPMAARLAPGGYDQLHHFIADGVWDAAPLESELLVQADRLVGGKDAVLVIDDTAMPKKGDRSVGVAPQYASSLGKTANCQTLVSLTLAQHLPGDEAWLIGEHRTSGEKKYYLANLPAKTDLRTLAATIKARWICEQAHQQLKEELGLDRFEGRSWQGLHRHALMTMVAYAFLQHRRLAQAGRKKKNQRASASAEYAGGAPSHRRTHRSTAASALPALQKTNRRKTAAWMRTHYGAAIA
jgi:SRSO17 transposase